MKINKKFSQHHLFIITGALLILALLTACGGSSSGGGNEDQDDDTDVTIQTSTYFENISGNTFSLKFYDTAIGYYMPVMNPSLFHDDGRITSTGVYSDYELGTWKIEKEDGEYILFMDVGSSEYQFTIEGEKDGDIILTPALQSLLDLGDKWKLDEGSSII